MEGEEPHWALKKYLAECLDEIERLQEALGKIDNERKVAQVCLQEDPFSADSYLNAIGQIVEHALPKSDKGKSVFS